MTGLQSLDAISAELARASHVYLPGSAAESSALRDWLEANPKTLAGKTLYGVWIAGINDFDYGALHPETESVAYFTGPALADGMKSGRTKLLSLSFSQIYRHLSSVVPLDLAFLHVSPPDENGYCSFGSCSDFGMAAWQRARRKVALVNPSMPTTYGSAQVRADSFDLLVEADCLPLMLPEKEPNEIMNRLGGHVASLVRDGDMLQLGIGSMQVAVLRAVAGRRNLRLHSGMISDAVIDLDRAGALAEGEGVVRTGIVAGDGALMEWIDRNPKLHMVPVSETHEPTALASCENLVAVNSALEVDLLGQVNAEARSGRIISSSGGLTDFVRMASYVPGGRPVVAFGSTAARGKISRIKPMLAEGTPVGITKSDPLIVVTEHGVADLRGLDFDAKAERLIAIADPAHRPMLEDGWRQLRSRLFG